MLAPIALALTAIVCLVVISGQGGDTGPSAAPAEVKKSTSVTKTTTPDGSAAVTTRTSYKVKAGDSFAAIAEKLGIDVNTLQDLNPEIDPRALQPGQKLKLR